MPSRLALLIRQCFFIRHLTMKKTVLLITFCNIVSDVSVLFTVNVLLILRDGQNIGSKVLFMAKYHMIQYRTGTLKFGVVSIQHDTFFGTKMTLLKAIQTRSARERTNQARIEGQCLWAGTPTSLEMVPSPRGANRPAKRLISPPTLAGMKFLMFTRKTGRQHSRQPQYRRNLRRKIQPP